MARTDGGHWCWCRWCKIGYLGQEGTTCCGHPECRLRDAAIDAPELWEGRARMAAARHAAGQALGSVDREALKRTGTEVVGEVRVEDEQRARRFKRADERAPQARS